MGTIWCDIETVGLDPARHDLWEIALLEEDGTEHAWHVWPDLSVAEPAALRLNGFYSRVPETIWDEPEEVAAAVAERIAGHHLAGACPWFDAAFLDVFLRRHGHAPAWHHRHFCIENYAAGYTGRPGPVGLTDTAVLLGVPVPAGCHNALVDARLAHDVYIMIRDRIGVPDVYADPLEGNG